MIGAEDTLILCNPVGVNFYLAIQYLYSNLSFSKRLEFNKKWS